ncbi:hypothetical protein PC123_g8958 [Phytophthora cactorum]|nr:hypothetical protein PC123_g8958 [Phytophthora cactorum]
MTSPPESTLASVKPTDGQTLGESGRPASRLLPVVDRHSLTHSLTHTPLPPLALLSSRHSVRCAKTDLKVCCLECGQTSCQLRSGGE